MNKNWNLRIIATIAALVASTLPANASPGNASPFKRLVDFNGDGKTDLFWYNYNTGDTAAWLINGSSVISYASYAQVPPSSGWSMEGFGDFNGDGKTDLFWYNNKTGDTAAWLINGSTVISYTSYAQVPPSSGWYIRGLSDFNGDGKTDLFWYNSNTRDTGAWLINGSSVMSYTNYAPLPPSSVWYRGFGDFNGDGKTDLLWYNFNTGDTAAWLINGTSVMSYANYAQVPPSSGWSIWSLGDFNGDGKTDLFWINSNTGDTAAWLINGSSVTNSANYAKVPSSSGWFPSFPASDTGKATSKWYQ